MASNTPNLNLYKKDPIADGADTFNITTMLNENWDKIDTEVGKKANSTNLTAVDTRLTQHLDERKQIVTAIKSVDQSLLNGQSQSIYWDSLEKLNESDFVELVSGQLRIKTKGVYLIVLAVGFTDNPTGPRSITAHHVAFAQRVNAASSGSTHLTASYTAVFDVGTILNLSASQSSGGALNIMRAYTRAVIYRLGDTA